MRLKKIILTNFKGVHGTKEFDLNGDFVTVSGMNGSGKTTLATAFMWVMCDIDINGNSRPIVQPNWSSEVSPSATLVFDNNGTELTVEKHQKTKVNKDGKATTINGFTINGVEKSATATKAYLEGIGIDFEKLPYLCNPSVFMSKDKKNMRKMLFEMASKKTDLEIAQGMSGVSEAVELLESYTMEECEAMQKQSLRKINDVHGTHGEITSAKIEGLQSAKVDDDIDLAEKELQKNALQEQIAAIDEKILSSDKVIQELQSKNMKLMFEQSTITQKLNDDLYKRRQDLQNKVADFEYKVSDLKSALNNMLEKKSRLEKKIEELEAQKEPLNEKFKENNARTFDESMYTVSESDTACPTCGRKFDENKIAEIIAENKNNIEQLRKAFLRDKETVKAELYDKANGIKAEIERAKKDIKDLDALMEKSATEIRDTGSMKLVFEEQLSALPEHPDFMGNADFKRLEDEVDKNHAEIAKIKNSASDEIVYALRNDRAKLFDELESIKEDIVMVSRNAEIDEQIESIRKKGMEYEQQRADAERVLDQLKKIGKRKNELLEDEVNSHFHMTKWKLFKYQKNGEVVDDCTPYLDGYDYGTSANHGREIQMQLDICYSLQRYFKQYMPVFLDNAESLNTSNFMHQGGTQLIALCVSEDKELKIERNDLKTNGE